MCRAAIHSGCVAMAATLADIVYSQDTSRPLPQGRGPPTTPGLPAHPHPLAHWPHIFSCRLHHLPPPAGRCRGSVKPPALRHWLPRAPPRPPPPGLPVQPRPRFVGAAGGRAAAGLPPPAAPQAAAAAAPAWPRAARSRVAPGSWGRRPRPRGRRASPRPGLSRGGPGWRAGRRCCVARGNCREGPSVRPRKARRW